MASLTVRDLDTDAVQPFLDGGASTAPSPAASVCAFASLSGSGLLLPRS